MAPRQDEIELDTFLGIWFDSMGNRVSVDWARTGNRGGQLDVELSKPRSSRGTIKLNVKRLGTGKFVCGHFDLDEEESHADQIVWLDKKHRGKSSIWKRSAGMDSRRRTTDRNQDRHVQDQHDRENKRRHRYVRDVRNSGRNTQHLEDRDDSRGRVGMSAANQHRRLAEVHPDNEDFDHCERTASQLGTRSHERSLERPNSRGCFRRPADGRGAGCFLEELPRRRGRRRVRRRVYRDDTADITCDENETIDDFIDCPLADREDFQHETQDDVLRRRKRRRRRVPLQDATVDDDVEGFPATADGLFVSPFDVSEPSAAQNGSQASWAASPGYEADMRCLPPPPCWEMADTYWDVAQSAAGTGAAWEVPADIRVWSVGAGIGGGGSRGGDGSSSSSGSSGSDDCSASPKNTDAPADGGDSSGSALVASKSVDVPVPAA
eukprot:TRINITY_DN15086_c1_g2_i1.p1 TRINITY_DN15086_c1_g2~~TRINITY_DN15086_c1_g2_i1.p1  ORF type:complete len:473 (+),score=71.64 TRINITY_DN15086_c1_g2_i1:112-1419(+)